MTDEARIEDLERYLIEMVRPTLIEFEANPSSRRHADVKCVVIAHAFDYLENPRAPQVRRNAFKHQPADFQIVN
ncbi:MAG: hypothetical protein E6614_22310 [Bradyrhizobium sp.]|jgi:hypothetical protein|uniref:Uncharacterized protein n=1 Tax=Bradyrhizobium denitrificans TaxID=2734912 RepID=A0ABS5G4H1_9BRAD|nr:MULTISPECIES: hypothetical protein [Bradyrhizobium]MDU1248686.1 hypothetical protein [Veillonella sp.]MBR1136148.1 hypothetical protein [Bradyrhizobium denitrificans]MDU0958684.1 hypothetical protein [Bradyrhizobium sp.]MDU1494331.1 hypothetical protein [Bradyrhizobium sp.]MDU1544489.1 hypothetical protein [Bradyrhizobium sp.]